MSLCIKRNSTLSGNLLTGPHLSHYITLLYCIVSFGRAVIYGVVFIIITGKHNQIGWVDISGDDRYY